MEYQFADRMKRLKASEVREILKVTERPEIMSFAGGLPAPELFPSKEISEHCQKVLAANGAKALQYATTEGFNPLREWIIDRLNNVWGMHVGLDNVMIISGSQSGLDLIAKLMIEEGDVVWCENPTYLAALTAFRVFNPVFKDVALDDEGIVLEGLEERIKQEKPKFIYVIPTFQNPSGRTWTMQRRKDFMELMTKYEIMVIEDNAYYEICYDDIEYCSLAKFDPKGLVVSLGSFSKVLCPGLRVAWISGAAPVIDKLVVLKQSTDLQTSTLNQMAIASYLQAINFEDRVNLIRNTYRERRNAMIESLAQGLPEGCTYTHPSGGMFIWITMPPKVDSSQLLRRCLKYNVAVVPGKSFYPYNPPCNTVRLNFSNRKPEDIREGVSRFCKALREELGEL